MAMSFRELHNNNDGGYDCIEIDLMIDNEKNKEKSIIEKVEDIEEFMVINDSNLVKKFKPQNFKSDEEWKEYYNYLVLECKLYNLKEKLKKDNAICPKCNNKNKKCTCICNECKKVGKFNCDCLPF